MKKLKASGYNKRGNYEWYNERISVYLFTNKGSKFAPNYAFGFRIGRGLFDLDLVFFSVGFEVIPKEVAQ